MLNFSYTTLWLLEETGMGFVVSILLTLLAALIGGLYLLGAFRRRQPGEPPLDKGPLPWLGHVLEFRRDSLKFLERMKKKHGDVFTVQLGGFYFTFIQDPLSFGPFVKESRTKLDFNTFAVQLVRRVFGYQAMEGDHEILKTSSNKNLMGNGLVVMTQAMMNNLQNLMLHSIGSAAGEKTWTEGGLFIYSYNIVFRAGYLALFGNETHKGTASEEKAKEVDRLESDALFSEFRKYDQLFPNLAYGVLPPKKKMEAERLKRLFSKTLSIKNIKAKDNVSGWISEMHRVREENGMDENMIDRYMFVLLWASQGNTGPSSFWLLLHLMKNPEAMRAVRKEVDKVLKETGQEVSCGGPLVNLTRDMLLTTPILDSAVEETLRLTAAPLLTRAVMQDMTIPMADGREFRIRQGDRVSLFPYSAVHIDPEVHPDPLTFKYNRFLNPDGSKKTEFYKAGRKLKYYNMPWGAGVSMCPGRFFATNELKQFVFLMLAYFDFELLNPDEKIPNIDTRRWGFGSMQPDRDVQFRYKLRF
ncbi:5-beta-cholestane-3-alpha,7-alpha-diol 12-alpha-hydroxylase-like [Genypterus blacodes]|uniref:5-beta-cholestane-3-alpha,7-alpha-diol 12-alpha-hydroxylase-like n=1 Tax=Genypterus blacodes TaxID=154954 RepID=UPI003F7610AC